jgi:short-subunit dehydrogenase
MNYFFLFFINFILVFLVVCTFMFSWRGVVCVCLCVALASFLWPYFISHPLVLQSKKVLICGASTGIGEEIAYRYAREGARIVLVARREVELQRVATVCRELGAQDVYVVPVDLSSEEGCEHTINMAVKHLGGLDSLILNHIIGYFENWAKYPHAQKYSYMQKIFQINAFSYFHLALTALPHLNHTNGKIGVVSSVAGHIGAPFTAPYSATKHSLHGFFNSLRHDLHGTTNVTITLHTIGNIETPNAVSNTQGYLTNLPRYPAALAADCIVDGTERGVRETYYPFLDAWFSSVMYPFAPDLMDRMVRQMMFG